MNESTNAPVSDELPPPVSAPWATMATVLAVLFVFGVLVALIMAKGNDLRDPSAGVAGAQQLSDLRAQEREILENCHYSSESDSWQIPIEAAMNALIEEGKTGGRMQSFPARPKK